MLLTTICRRWRELAVNLPGLWCSLQLASHVDFQRKALGYDSWLKRSQGCPLSLRIGCSGDLSELRHLLQPYIQQITSLTLYFSNCNEPFMIEDFHSLKKLTIHNSPPNHDPNRNININLSLSKLPTNLRRINIVAGLFYGRKELGLFKDSAWAGLTHIEIDVHGLDSFIRVLCLCPNLTSMTVYGIFPNNIRTLEPVTHTNLQSLEIVGDQGCKSGTVLGLFDVITLPSLRTIEVSQMGAWPHEEFKAFLTRSKCSLKSLVFGAAVLSTVQQREEYATFVPSFIVLDCGTCGCGPLTFAF